MNIIVNKRGSLILFSSIFIFFYSNIYSQIVQISSDRTHYNASDSIKLFIQNPLYQCGHGSRVINIDLIDEKLKLVDRFYVQADKYDTEIKLAFSGLTSGRYILSAYINGLEEYGENDVNNILIFVNTTDSIYENSYVLSIMPEGGRGLLNFQNRFRLYLRNIYGKPISERILVFNKTNQLIARTVTDNFGLGFADIPVLPNDSITFVTGNGVKLFHFFSNEYSVITDTGFTIRGSIVNDSIYIEMRRGEKEANTLIKLEAYINELLIFNAFGVFNKDTNIVETRFPIQGFENKLINIVLKSQANEVVAKRLMFLSKSNELVSSKEIFCEVNCNFPSRIDKVWLNLMNDILIGCNYLNRSQSLEQEKGIRLNFRSNQFANTQLKYSLTDEKNSIIEIGIVDADSSGLITIKNCNFFQTAFARFYIEGKEVTNVISREPFKPLEYEYERFIARTVCQSNETDKKNSGYKNEDLEGMEKTLQEVKVTSAGANRIQQLEKKYIRNGMFYDLNSYSIDVESDSLGFTYSFFNFLEKHIPGLLKRKIKINGILTDVLTYRGGFIEYYIDEVPISIDGMSNNFIDLRDVGFIKFFRNPISSGLSSQRGGQALPGGSGYVAGLQGSVAIYTKKYSEEKVSKKSKGIEVRGYENSP